MAKAFLVYGPRGAGKTTTTLKLADALSRHGVGVGGYFQRNCVDELERRGYDLVSVQDRSRSLPLARPGGLDRPGVSTVCTFSFSQESLDTALGWLQSDACRAQALVIDEISKLEARGEGHAQALRWALALDASKLLLLSVRAELLFYVVEAFALHDRIAGYIELPTTQEAIEAHAGRLAAALAGR